MEHPFDRAYVLNVTHNHILKSIDHSIIKTGGRLKDVDDDKRLEVYETLATLHKWREMEIDFRNNNLHIFGE